MPHLKSLAAALMLITAGCIGGPGGRPDVVVDSGEVAFELEGPGGAALMVPVHINGSGPYSFVLDTGATLSCVDGALRDSLGLPERSGIQGYGAGIGGSGRVQLVEADSLRLGDVVVAGLTLCVIELGQLEVAGLNVDGLIGLNFLQEFRVTLDFDRGVVSFD